MRYRPFANQHNRHYVCKRRGSNSVQQNAQGQVARLILCRQTSDRGVTAGHISARNPSLLLAPELLSKVGRCSMRKDCAYRFCHQCILLYQIRIATNCSIDPCHSPGAVHTASLRHAGQKKPKYRHEHKNKVREPVSPISPRPHGILPGTGVSDLCGVSGLCGGGGGGSGKVSVE